MVVYDNMPEPRTQIIARKILCTTNKFERFRDRTGQFEGSNKHLGLADLETVLDVGSRDRRIDRRGNRANLVQRPPSEHELGRIVDEQANDHSILDSQTLECFCTAADLLSKTNVSPASAFKHKCFLVIV